MSKEKTKKEIKHLCPHCKKEIPIGKMMAQASLVGRDVSSERMRAVANARWNRKKLYGV